MLQKNEISTCIVEKKLFPRAKLCGGLLTQKTVDLLSEIFGSIAFPYIMTTSNLKLFLGTQLISSVTTDSTFYLTERMKFDHYLIEMYLELDGSLVENATITSLDQSSNIATLSNGQKIQYKYLVGADGANSQTRKLIDEKYRPNAMCLEVDVASENVEANLEIYLSAIHSGYGWRFPKMGYYTVGIGGDRKKNRDIKELFVNFSMNINQSINESEIKGALIPFGKFVKQPCKNNIILIGDAAGFVDPITGEGLYFAFYSAKCACNSILDCFHSEHLLSKQYLARIRYIQNIIKDGKWFNRLFFNDFMRQLLLKLIIGKTNSVKYLAENVISNYNISYCKSIFKYLIIRYRRKRSEKNGVSADLN
jgi:flavin-dependent dehydrogenase